MRHEFDFYSFMGQNKIPGEQPSTKSTTRFYNFFFTILYCSIYSIFGWSTREWDGRGNVARLEERRGVYRVLVGKPEGKRLLGWSRRRWEDNIKMYLQEAGCRCTDWIELAQDRDRCRALVNTVMNLWFPWNAVNFLTGYEPVSFSRRTLLREMSK